MQEEMQERMNAPACIGVIMDGNRRWAKEHSLPTLEGHRRGFRKFKELAAWSKEVGVKHVIVYALSTENWNRSKEEVSYLLDLFREIIRDEVDGLKEDGVRIVFAGDLSRFPEDLEQMMRRTEEETKHNTDHTMVIAASYGGRAEITSVVNTLLKEGVVSVSEDDIAGRLWTKGVPDPDLIIRTGGEKRLSNFLPWQSTYSELFFSDTYWPDFSKEEFLTILDEFSQRERRRGR